MIVFWLIACSPHTVWLPADPVPPVLPGPAAAELSATELRFEALLTADGLFGQDQVLSVHNAGASPLQVLGYAVDDPSGAFSLTGPGQMELGPGDSTTLVVHFSPVDSVIRRGTIRIATTDPEQMELTAEVIGQAIAPSLTVDTSTCNFENTPTGCSRSCVVDVANTGTAPLRVDQLRLEGSILADTADFPWHLSPGARRSVTIRYEPLSAAVEENRIVLESNDPDRPEWSDAIPASSPGEVVAQENHPVEGGEVDILVVAKADGSMRGHLRSLVAGIPALMEELDRSGANWRLAGVVEDSGCITGNMRFLDTSVAPADRPGALQQMLLEAKSGNLTQAGFLLAERALSGNNVDVGGCNVSFRRATYPLAIVGLSNAAEASGGRWFDHVNLLRQIADANLQINAFAGMVPSSCQGVDPGVGWYEATNATSGSFVSLCDSAMGGFTSLARTIVADRTTVSLSGVPVPSTLAVQVDGRAIGRGWHYDATENSVVFEQDAPLFGSVVTVDYVAEAVCE